MRYNSAEETRYKRTQNKSYYFFMLGLEFVLLRKTEVCQVQVRKWDLRCEFQFVCFLWNRKSIEKVVIISRGCDTEVSLLARKVQNMGLLWKAWSCVLPSIIIATYFGSLKSLLFYIKKMFHYFLAQFLKILLKR